MTAGLSTESTQGDDETNEFPLRVGLAGGGFIGATVGAQFVDDDRSRVVALADIAEDVLESTGDDLGVSPASRYEDYETMLDAESLDAVLVGTPHTLHYDQIRAAFDRDLHVLCDKPLTTDLDDARDLVERDRERDETLMVGYQRHVYAAYRRARDVWNQPDREPTWITAEVSQSWVDPFEGTWRQDPSLSGGGYLYDTGSHLLDGVLWSTELTPTAVAASMDFLDDDQRVDGRATVTVRFENGATGSFTLSGETPCMREHVRMWDDQGAVVLDSKDWEPSDYTEIDAESGEYRPRLDRDGQPTKAGAFLDAIETGEEPVATALDGLRVTAVTEAAYASARGDGSFVDVDPADVALDRSN